MAATRRARDQEASPSTPPPRYKYQVFLSFRGEDTRKNFTDHLYTALVNAGFYTFRDNDELERGEDITSELMKAIQQSQISVVVFSKNYASSRWCLDELHNILLERKKNMGHVVLPVFYHIDPSHVRNQTGTFAEAFARHEKHFEAEMDKVERWRAALREAADMAGMSLQNQANGHEAQFIQNIIEEIEKKLNRTVLSVGLHLTGTDSRVKYINSWLQDESSGIIGVICGMGGIGKTTIAKIAYNLNFNKFEGSSFLANVREAFAETNGLVRLQKQLLSDILTRKKNKINNVDEGIIKIGNAVHRKRFLMVLDDVDQLVQIDSILGMRDWFCSGSKVIITTRHERLLKAHETCAIFKVKVLDNDESLQLFSWHAFGQSHPIVGYMEHSRSIVQHCGGLPLALQVLGSSLSGRSVDVWGSAIRKLKTIPDSEILEKLKISYDTLRDDHDKNLFLDIACYFVGNTKDFTITVLDSCVCYTTVGIQNLVDRCLITIGYDDKIWMHQLLQDMGRVIVFRESPKNPGKQSRLWDHKDAISVLKKKTGTDAIEGLILNFPKVIEDMPYKAISFENNAKRRRLGWHTVNTSSQTSFSMPNNCGDLLTTEAFAMMHNLRLLSLNYVQLLGGYENFPQDIRLLCWHGFRLESIPTNLCLENLVALEMRNSCLTHLWKGIKSLGNLKILDLSYSHDLIKTSDFSRVPNLERLMLKHCISLVEVHESIGCLDRLDFLSLKGCKNLTRLPRTIGMLKSLRKLILSGCSKLELFDGSVKSESVRALHADDTTTNHLSSSISAHVKQRLHSVRSSISRRQPPKAIHYSMVSLPRSLVTLSLEKSNLNAIPGDICTLSQLQVLQLGGNPIHSLPESIRHLTMLKTLDLFNCVGLQSLPELPNSLTECFATLCTSLERITNLPNLLRCQLSFVGCKKLVEVQGLFKLEPVGNTDKEIADSLRLFGIGSPRSIPVHVNMHNSLSALTWKMPIQKLYECGIISIFLPGSEIPRWLRCKKIGSEITFQIRLLPNQKIQGLNVYVVYTKMSKRSPTCFRCNYIRVCNVTKGCRWDYSPVCLAIPERKKNMTWLSHWKFGDDELKDGDKVTVSVVLKDDGFLEKKIGIHLVCKEEEQEEVNPRRIMERSSNSPTWFQNVIDWNNSAHVIKKDVAYVLCNHNNWEFYGLYNKVQPFFLVKDVESVLALLRDEGNNLHIFHTLIDDCRSLLTTLTVIAVRHTFREGNRATDFLARRGLLLNGGAANFESILENPGELCNIFSLDLRSVTTSRLVSNI